MLFRKTRYLLGFAALAAGVLFILFYPIASLLSWQSYWFAKSFFILILAFALCFVRIIFGPAAADRAAAIDALGILVVGFCAILSVPTGRDWYLDIAIAWALQSFISALALAKYMEGRRFDA
jgi:multicomponent Na+:H+ antiporter subunit F